MEETQFEIYYTHISRESYAIFNRIAICDNLDKYWNAMQMQKLELKE